ncbi:MAG: hypothetical protein QXI27_02150 [Nitrososphaerota archaeon]
MKIVIDDVEYELETKARAWPLLSLIQKLTSPSNLEEALKMGEELERIVDKVLEICVKPFPDRPEHKPLLIIALMKIEERAVRDAYRLVENFRE